MGVTDSGVTHDELSQLTERLLERNERLPLGFKLVPAQALADFGHLEVQLTDLHTRSSDRAASVAKLGQGGISSRSSSSSSNGVHTVARWNWVAD